MKNLSTRNVDLKSKLFHYLTLLAAKLPFTTFSEVGRRKGGLAGEELMT
jgi:hypothetical protein